MSKADGDFDSLKEFLTNYADDALIEASLQLIAKKSGGKINSDTNVINLESCDSIDHLGVLMVMLLQSKDEQKLLNNDLSAALKLARTTTEDLNKNIAGLNLVEKENKEKFSKIEAVFSNAKKGILDNSKSIIQLSRSSADNEKDVSEIKIALHSSSEELDKLSLVISSNSKKLHTLTLGLIVSTVMWIGVASTIFVMQMKNTKESDQVVLQKPVTDLKKYEESVSKEFFNNLMGLAMENKWPLIDEKIRKVRRLTPTASDAQVANVNKTTGLNFLAKGEFGLALVDLEKSLSSNPDDIEVNIGLGNAELKLGHPEKATVYFLDGLMIDPMHAAAWLSLSEAFVENNKSSAAEAAIRLAVHFARDQAKALNNLTENSELSKESKLGIMIKKSLPVLATVPKFDR